jgi:type IV pilus assembly protein PilA
MQASRRPSPTGPRRLLPAALRSEPGFTLIEVLIITIVVAILAAIAIPAFLGQKQKAQDASAKSDAAALALLVESCYVESQDYTACSAQSDLDGTPGVAWGNNPGDVRVTAAAQDTYELTAMSRAASAGANHRFVIQRNPDGTSTRTCKAGLSNNEGGCRNATW